jgi:hypothetical protein
MARRGPRDRASAAPAGAVPASAELAAASAGAALLERAAASRSIPLRVRDIAGGEVQALYERRLVLVRPDGHVAWRGDEMADPAAAAASLALPPTGGASAPCG